MRAEQRAIYQLLQPKSQFLMPEFQRRYVWTKDDVRRLWEDIDAVSHDSGSRHFLGAIVLSPIGNAGGFKKRFVVDGQQRLTTLSILFCALRDHAAATYPDFAKTINNVYLENQGEAGEDRFKLVPLASTDRGEWLAIVKRAANAGGENSIGEAYRTFRSRLSGRAFRELKALERLEQTIAYQCDVVEVEVEPDRGDNEYRIFNSLNEGGGVKLQQSDLIRSFMLMRLPSRSREVYERYWAPIQELLTSSEVIDELVQANLVLRGRTRTSTDDVYRQFRELMKNASEDQVEAWSAELFRQAQLYRCLIGEVRHSNAVLNAAIGRLTRWDSKAGHPLALAILMAHEQGKLDAGVAARALRVVESYLVRRALLGIDSKSNAENIARVARDVSGKNPTPELLVEKLAHTADGYPTDDQVRDAVVETNAYTPGGKNATTRFVLRYIEDALEPREQVDLDDRRYTIEHILPRALTDEWRASLAVDGASDIDDAHIEVVHKLGNLTLTRYNHELDRDPWEVKREQLARSGLAMNRDLATQPTWGRRQIRERSSDLADRIVQIWPGPLPMATPVPVQKTGPAAESTPTTAPADPDPTPITEATTTEAPAAEAPRRRVSARDRLWSRLPEILAVIPAGRWTSYADIGEVLGVGAGEVGQHLQPDMVNAHRVLSRAKPVPRTEDQRGLLANEGVRLEANGRAAAELRCGAEFLRTALDEGAPDPARVAQPA